MVASRNMLLRPSVIFGWQRKLILDGVCVPMSLMTTRDGQMLTMESEKGGHVTDK
jgi:hypothetical protein